MGTARQSRRAGPTGFRIFAGGGVMGHGQGRKGVGFMAWTLIRGGELDFIVLSCAFLASFFGFLAKSLMGLGQKLKGCGARERATGGRQLTTKYAKHTKMELGANRAGRPVVR